jgi:hypothetical protein
MNSVVGVWVRTSALQRLIWGGVLLAVPGPVLRCLGGRPTRTAKATLRLLGARHLVQATATTLCPDTAMLATGAGLDGLHAITAIALAVIDRPQRRIALTDAGIAVVWIGLDLHAALRPPRQGMSRLATSTSGKPRLKTPNSSTYERGREDDDG